MALFEPSCGEAYADVFSDATDTDFCVLGYEGRKLKCDAKGVGGLEALVATFDDDKVQYGLLRQIRTDTEMEDRIIILEMIWVVVLADGQIDEHESQLMRRLAGLLFIDDVEAGLAAKRARIRVDLAD